MKVGIELIDLVVSIVVALDALPRSLSEQQLFDLQLIGYFSFEKIIYLRLFGHIGYHS